MGFADTGFMKYSLVADHYQHIAIIGVVALLAAAWSVGQDHAPPELRPAATAVAPAVVAILTLLSWQQNRLYADPIVLYRATLEKNPDTWLIRNNLGGELTVAGRPLEAIEQFQEAVRQNPAYREAFNNLGIVLGRLGRIPEAIAQFQHALAIDPHYADAHSNLGLAYFKTDRPQEAIAEFETALRLQPNHANAHFGLARALAREGRFQEAVDHFRQALHFSPNLTEACAQLAETYAQMQQPTEAIAAAQRAIELARLQGQASLESKISAWLDDYRAQQSQALHGHD